jgi:hypothetical protein
MAVIGQQDAKGVSLPDRLASHSLIGMVASFIIWSVYFAAAYSFQAAACIRGFQGVHIGNVDAVSLVLIVMTAITLIAIAYLGWRSLLVAHLSFLVQDDVSESPRADFMALTAALLAGLAFVATLWVALPMLLLPTCA